MIADTLVPHSRPWVTAADIEAVAAVVRSEQLATGHARRRFERRVAEWLRVPEAGVAVASGRAALHVALRALGIRTGDEVIVPTYACTSLQQAVAALGARPVPCDAGPQWLLTPETVAPRVTRRTRAIVVVHLYGYFTEASRFRRFGVPIVEDFAQAFPGPGARTLDGDLGICSFHPTKCLTTGEGGMVLASARDLAERARRAVLAPLSDMAAALGLAQLERYPDALRRRQAIAARYRSRLAAVAPEVLVRQPRDGTVDFRFPISLPGGVDAWAPAFAARGVTVRRGVDRLLHREMGLRDRAYPQAVEHLATTVSLPLYPALDDAAVERCLEAAAAICAALPGWPDDESDNAGYAGRPA